MKTVFDEIYYCRTFDLTFKEHLKILKKPSLVFFVKSKEELPTIVSSYPNKLIDFFDEVKHKYYVISNNQTGYLYINGKEEIRNKK